MVSIQRPFASVMTLDGAVQRLALEALGLKDLPDLLALAFGRDLDMPLLHVAHMLIFLDLGLGAGIVGGGHGEAVGEQIGHAEDEQSLGGKHAPVTPATTAKVVTVPSMPP